MKTTTNPTLLNLTDEAELAAEISAVDGVPLDEARALAAEHLGHITRTAAQPSLRALLEAAEQEARPMLAAQAERRAH